MKIYPNLSVIASYQSFGETWLIILEGETAELNTIFNSFYNFGGVSGRKANFNWENNAKTLLSFSSSKKSIWKFFYNRNWFIAENKAESIKFADTQLEEFKKSARTFRSYNSNRVNSDVYETGQQSAENLDNDGRDLILNNAFGIASSSSLPKDILADEEEQEKLKFVSVLKINELEEELIAA